MLLIGKGQYKYPHQVAGKNARYLGWGVFRVKATGQEMLFTTTHLDPYSKSVRVAQWRDMIAKVNKLKGSRPVVVTGDFNSTKYSPWASSLLPRDVGERVRRRARPALPDQPRVPAPAEHPPGLDQLVQPVPPRRADLLLLGRPNTRRGRAPATGSTGSSRRTG